MCVCVCVCIYIYIYIYIYIFCQLHSLDDALLGLQQEVAVVHARVSEVHLERAEGPEGLGVLSLQLLGHVEAVHHLALPPLLRLGDAVQKLHLQHHKHMQHKCSLTT